MHVLMHTRVRKHTYTFWLFMLQFTNALLLLGPERCLSEQVIFQYFISSYFPFAWVNPHRHTFVGQCTMKSGL